MEKRPLATIIMEDGAEIIIALYPDEAPNTVRSFISLANQGAFDDHAIQRIVPGYVVDASYNAFGKDLCKYLIPNEAKRNSAILPMAPGVIGMGGYDGEIAGGEFFFPLEKSPKLEGQYPAFGKILSGLDTILGWGRLPLRPVSYPESPDTEVNIPEVPLVIHRVRVETFGALYSSPEKLIMTKKPPSW